MWRNLLGTTLGVGITSIDRIEATLGDVRRTAAFARGRVMFRPRASDLYVATYPRSGTTWMQFMLHLLLRGPSTDFVHINEVCPWFERSLSTGSWSAEGFERLASPRIFKTHLLRRWLPPQGKFIYIERDPVDVASSYYDLYRSYLGYRGSLGEFVERFLAGDVQYGSWWAHVGHWRAHAGDSDVLLLRYEDLRADPAVQLRTVVDFADLRASDAAVNAAVEGASLPRMKAIEDRFDHATSLLLERGVMPRRFIGRGEVGGGGRTLSAEDRARLQDGGNRPTRREPWLPAFLH